jgi:hypothetical protein
MKLQLVARRRGVLWLRHAFALFFKQPFAFAGLFVMFLFAIVFIGALPLVGALLVLAALPLGSLAFMAATRVALQGRAPWAGTIAAALRADRAAWIAQLKLGAIYAGATLAIVFVSQAFDGGALDALMETLMSGKATPESISEQLAAPMLAAGLVLRFGLLGLLSVPFWHAPALIHWGGQGALQALFSSTLACWRNRGAFAAYGLAWAATILLFALLIDLVFTLLGQSALIALAATPLTLILSTVFYVSLYFTFDDCFMLSSESDAAPAEP